MQNKLIQEIVIEELLPKTAAETITQTMDAISSAQRSLYALAESDDSGKLNLLKIGTVFQIFLIDTLASGKTMRELDDEDWKNICNKVVQYAVIEDGQHYSEFIFTLYADYIDLSAETWQSMISEKSYDSIKDLASSIRHNDDLLREEKIKETDYIEACLWLSLEAMIKLLSSSLALVVGVDFADLTAAVSQLAFEYGRYVLYSREQAILEEYLEKQHVLDEQLQRKYYEYLADVQREAEQFRRLIDEAFSPELHESLMQTAALARAAGVREEELLTTVNEVDAFFME